MLELRLVRYFVAVAETEHVGRAADRLHVSQSPLSRQVRQLEELLGVELFVREGRRIRLAPAGRALLGPARDLLARADAFVRDAAAGAAAPRLAIGFVGTAVTTGVLPAALRAVRKSLPELAIELDHNASPALVARVRAGELDLALVHGRPTGRDLHATLVLEQPYRLAVPRGSPPARMRLDAEMLGTIPWIAIRGSTQARQRWLDACAAAGFSPNVAVEVDDYPSALALVEAGIGVTAVPASTAHSPTIALRALPMRSFASTLWAVTRLHASPLAITALSAMRDAACGGSRAASSRTSRR